MVSPATPYVCVGYHQDVAQEVDLDYCQSKGVPVFRRDLGGGAVYLDGNQLFYQIILRKDNPQVPKNKRAFYEKFLQPVIRVYRRVGISAEYKPINDVIAGARKISGTGVGEIEDCIVFVGNLIVDFDYEAMARVLRVPDDKFRDKVYKTLVENLSTIRRELGEETAAQWDEGTLNALMVEEFGKLLGPMEPHKKDTELQAKIDELGNRMMTEAWLYQRGKKVSGRDVKIRSGINVIHKVHKAPGGLIRADFEVGEGKFLTVSLSGDFFCFPEEAVGLLESKLEGEPVQDARELVASLYSEKDVETPGIDVEDWAQVLKP